MKGFFQKRLEFSQKRRYYIPTKTIGFNFEEKRFLQWQIYTIRRTGDLKQNNST